MEKEVLVIVDLKEGKLEKFMGWMQSDEGMSVRKSAAHPEKTIGAVKPDKSGVMFKVFVHNEEKMKEMSKEDHSMGHSHANSVLLEPDENGEIIWKFNTEAKLEAACNIPGHYETGMIAKIKY